MRFHCLGAGGIGSLIATNLARLPASKVRLILRRKDLAGAILTNPRSHSSRFAKRSRALQVSLTIENLGLQLRTDGLEIELTPSPEDKVDSNRLISLGDGKGIGAESTKFADLVKYDPIESLFINTKAPSVLPGIQPLLARLSSKSTVVLCHNGMGVLERLLDSYWPDDSSSDNSTLSEYTGSSRPSFVCAITTHGVWRKGNSHFVHAGTGDLKFAVVPNRAALAAIAATPSPSWGEHYNNPLLNSRSLVIPTLEHIPLTPETESLHATISAILSTQLNSHWLPLPTFQISQLQKLAVNSSINSLTSIMGVSNGSLLGSELAKSLISTISTECSNVFAAHLARESGRWDPPPIPQHLSSFNSSSSITSSTTSSDDSDFDFPSTSLSPPPPPIPHPPPPPLPTSHPLSPSSLIDYTLRIIFSTSINLSSTLQDLLNTTKIISTNLRSRTEIDYINGYVIALGRRYGIETVSIETMGQLVKLKEEMMRSGAVDRVLERKMNDMHLSSGSLPKEGGTRMNSKSITWFNSTNPSTSNRVYSPSVVNKKIGAKPGADGAQGVQKFERAQRVLKEKNSRSSARVAIEKAKRLDNGR